MSDDIKVALLVEAAIVLAIVAVAVSLVAR